MLTAYIDRSLLVYISSVAPLEGTFHQSNNCDVYIIETYEGLSFLNWGERVFAMQL